MGRRHFITQMQPTDEGLVAKARRLRARGELRKAVVAFREACMRDESAVALWTIYGALEARLGHEADARRALKHALWLRRAAHDEKRARSTQNLLDHLMVPSAA